MSCSKAVEAVSEKRRAEVRSRTRGHTEIWERIVVAHNTGVDKFCKERYNDQWWSLDENRDQMAIVFLTFRNNNLGHMFNIADYAPKDFHEDMNQRIIEAAMVLFPNPEQ